MAERVRAKRGFSRRQKLLLIGLVVVNLLVYALLAVFFLRPRPRNKIVPESASYKLALQEAHDVASALATGWQPDAHLVGATTGWRLTGGDRLTLGRPAWSFNFYSAAARQVQIVVVDQGGAQAIRTASVGAAPAPVEADWSVDSGDLLLTFMAYGGEDFVAKHPHVNIHFQLSGKDGGRSIWYLSAIDPAARQTFTIGVDALSREVVFGQGP